MFSAATFREVVSGRRKGPGAWLLRGALAAAEGPYALAVWWRNRRYDRGAAPIQQVSVPVISVGNITLGGTGKTPFVEWLAVWFRRHQVRVTLISRGYGAEAGSQNDEALELEQRLPDVPHLQNPDRVEAARTATEEFDCQLIVLDDAFQHRRIGRDLDIVLIDALDPFGCGHVFPRGLLREPLAGLRRAHAVVLSRADLVSAARREEIRQRLAKYAPEASWAEAVHAPRELRNASAQTQSLAGLGDLRVAAFCGLGNPAGFRQTLVSCGCDLAGFREFSDHNRYDRRDVESLAQWADQLPGVQALVTTHKDLVKLGVDRIGRHPLWALVIGLEFLAGQEEVETLLTPLLHRALRIGADRAES